MDNEQMFDEATDAEIEEQAAEAVPADQDALIASMREHFESDAPLSDDELDFVADVTVGFIREILSCFGEEDVSIDEYEGDDGELILDVNGGNLAVLIGRHGRTLDALQLLVSSLVSKRLGFHYPVVVDIEGYKSRRRQKLQSMALSSAARAKEQQTAVRMKPMNAYERRLVHLALVNDAEVTTHSEGEDPERYVVITPLRA